MLTIILNWFYILFTCFCIGFAFSCFTEKVLHYTMKRVDSILMTGLIIATVYAQAFSLFYRVNIEANMILIAVCLGVCIALRKRMAGFIKAACKNCTLPCKIIIPLLFLAWSFYTSRGYIVPDTQLYHGQSIRWIEEYGVVKGLGNLHGRFGYNSSVFALSALYSMKFLLGRSLHAVNGFLAFAVSLTVLDIRKCFRRKKMLLSDYARIGAMYYMSLIWDEIIAPSSDYAVMLTIFFIVIKWLSQLEAEDERERNNITPYALLCVASVYALTLKLSAGLILVFVLKPAFRLLKEKRWKEICIYLILGLATALPWMTRTVMITGWLFYPFAEIDWFDVDWKMKDIGAIKTDAFYVKVWAKGANHLADMSLKSWFPNWFKNVLFNTEKCLVLADLAVCATTLVFALIVFVKRQWHKLDVLLVMATMACCYMFWQFSAPMMRYGYAYVLLLAALGGGYVIEKLRPARIIYVFFVAYGAYRLFLGCNYIVGCCSLPNYVWQETYETNDVESYEIDGVTIYYTPDGSGAGYEPFPSIPTQELGVELRGEGIEDGFRMKDNADN